ncbi:MAG: hypothetical protein J0M22_05820 [Gammaproteobacteria bacterium]|nr:hypothetical protein [Gammaproteobacteria bacterium]
MTKAQQNEFKNGIRHVAWQASITMEEGLESAVDVGRLHELGEENSIDSMADQHNNAIGQSIGQSAKDLHGIIEAIGAEIAAGNIITSYSDSRLNQTLPTFVDGDSSYSGSGSTSSGGSGSSTSSCSSGSYSKC